MAVIISVEHQLYFHTAVWISVEVEYLVDSLESLPENDDDLRKH